MADLEVGKDSNLTTTLATTDRITITRAATGQKVATMTVAEFMKKCAVMMPVATASANGVMSKEDQITISRFTSQDIQILINQEMDFPLNIGGVYFLWHLNSGQTAIVLTTSLQNFHVMGSTAHFSGNLNNNGTINIGRKETNGRIYIQNKRDSNVDVRIAKL